eukprot:CAMPEP_0171782240 /NCGR_PEP_ID=MMETSP0991-20121206/60722_1 /TAXON_ID=483369 /ORGANISM="non described non described, Strain CCMP2098" /LENGTH=41 /DNA_ID= /DNA_START= /DNA_END= /DNA_ORIENTATION=
MPKHDAGSSPSNDMQTLASPWSREKALTSPSTTNSKVRSKV